MNVCVIAEYYPRRRDRVLGVWAHEQALAARSAGAEVRVLVLERPIPPFGSLRDPRELVRELHGIATQPRHDQIDGLEVEYVRYASPPRARSYAGWDRWARPLLERALDRLDADWHVDLVHAHYALPAGAAARLWATEHGHPLVISVHGGDVHGPLLDSPVARSRIGEVLRSADGVLCNSTDTLRRSAALAGGEDGMRVVRLGARAPEPVPPKHAEPTVATLGHVIARKGHEDVLSAVASEGFRWVVIGDGPERPGLERLAQELGADVRWLGQLEHPQALEELARCHVMALPSRDEAFGVAYVEALACGVPAIGCAGEGGPEEIAALGDGMVLVPPRDPPALAAALGRVIGEGEALAERARATAREHFTWEHCGEETVAAYRDALLP